MVAEGLLLALVVVVCTVLAFALTREWVPRVLLLVTSVAVSGLLFLPSDWLVDLVGINFVHRLYDWSRATPWRPPEWIHLLGFAWLAFALWLARPPGRRAPLVAALVVLAIAAELAQWLTATRTPRLEDMGVNLLGVALGVGAGATLMALLPGRR